MANLMWFRMYQKNVGKIYRHYKTKGEYKITDISWRESDMTPVYTYEALYEMEDLKECNKFNRPCDKFHEKIDGKQRRFELVKEYD